ncbi:GMC family oxidoreductase [Shimia thalassica]|uniref:GMC oxidoreductase n=1 Tax=Shimia thalassica TaxID=1715693 RepID=UPI001C092479|nr:GMC family oxidoreductase [Shimia thalassica]MBU2942316.1 GMC family oxidoreductase [Shimia thalassica]MDO6504244.1 GMC family oxidoreductase [Shimia thalassica]
MSQDVFARDWDVIVVGTGMGGGPLGRRLAEKGWSVLFVERGPLGHPAAQHDLNYEMADPVARHVRGYWPTPVQATVNNETFEFFAPLGSGVGGSSTFYAGALERPEPHDLDDSTDRPHPTGGWPVSFAQMQPWLAEAEAMFMVNGTQDPLGDGLERLLAPNAPRTDEAALIAGMQANGLHPYQGHLAFRRDPSCPTCISGGRCAKHPKMDGRTAGVDPALETGHAALLTNATVRRLKGHSGRVSEVEIETNMGVQTLKSRIVVLAAGALSSPGILLNSASEEWPDGCANSSGLVGRNLMFHMNEMFALWPPKSARTEGPTKAIAMRDLYYKDGQRLGLVQAMGIEAKYGEIVHFLNLAYDRSFLRRFRLLKQFTRIPALIAAKLFGSAAVFVGILEDLPYKENRVIADRENPDQLAFEYTISPELLMRRKTFRTEIKRALRGMRMVFLNRGPELNYGHACGTLKFGSNPAESVLDETCKSHDLDNLYVADSSFMPTSFGTNPSLTIAANALRVADHIHGALLKEKDLGHD